MGFLKVLENPFKKRLPKKENYQARSNKKSTTWHQPPRKDTTRKEDTKHKRSCYFPETKKASAGDREISIARLFDLKTAP